MWRIITITIMNFSNPKTFFHHSFITIIFTYLNCSCFSGFISKLKINVTVLLLRLKRNVFSCLLGVSCSIVQPWDRLVLHTHVGFIFFSRILHSIKQLRIIGHAVFCSADLPFNCSIVEMQISRRLCDKRIITDYIENGVE